MLIFIKMVTLQEYVDGKYTVGTKRHVDEFIFGNFKKLGGFCQLGGDVGARTEEFMDEVEKIHQVYVDTIVKGGS